MERDARIYVAGGETLLGRALLRVLERAGYVNIIGRPGQEPELTNAADVGAFFAETTPEYVFCAAGRSAGIAGNQKYPADLMLHNLLVTCNILGNSFRQNVRKLLYLASSCTYPKHCAQPMRERDLLTGPLEPTSEAYAIAKIAGITMCRAYRRQYGVNFVSAVPGDVFGPGDDFSPEDSHVVAALIRKMHEAKTRGMKTVEVWGTGTAAREFIFAEDLADASLFVMRSYNGVDPINIGGGGALSIRELAVLIREVVGYEGELVFDETKPDGTPRKLLDSHKLKEMGWRPRTSFREAILETYNWFLKNRVAEEVSDAR